MNRCSDCGKYIYLVQLHDGTVTWVSHLNGTKNVPGTIICRPLIRLIP
jgi:hypothetical protein